MAAAAATAPAGGTTFFTGNNTREIKELRALLNSLEVQRSDGYVGVVKRVIQYMTLGMDVSGLLSEMIMATSTKNLVQKKLVYLYLCTYADTNAELALLVINTLQKDCRDENPIVRGLALRSLCSLRLPNIVEYITVPLKTCLGDVSAYVRKTATLGCVKLYHMAPRIVKESDVVDRLYALLRDRDPQVLANSVAALDEILADEGGMALNRPLALHLYQQLRHLNEWGQCLVLDVLARYQPDTEDEVYTLLNVLDERLKHNNSAVVMAAVKLFITLTAPLEHLHEDVYNRVKEPLLTILSAGSPELSYTCLAHLQLLNMRASNFLESDYKYFFLRFNDPSYIRSQKLALLVDVATAANAGAIIEELSEYVTDVSTVIACRSITSLGEIAQKVGGSAVDAVVDKLLSFDDLDIDYISAQTLVTIKDLVVRFPARAREVLDKLRQTLRVQDAVDAKTALLFILGDYGDMIDDAPYIIEPLINNLANERSSVVRLSLLTATMKLFFKRPAEVQMMFGKLLQTEISGELTLLTEPHDRALLYHRLLQKGVEVARRVVDSAREASVSIGDDDDTRKLMDQLFNELNSLAVVYRRPSELFIQQMPPYVKAAPTGTSPSPAAPAAAPATVSAPAQATSQAAPSQRAPAVSQSLIDFSSSPGGPAPLRQESSGASLLDDFLSPPSPAVASPSITATRAMAGAGGPLPQLSSLSISSPASVAVSPASAQAPRGPASLRMGVSLRLDPQTFQTYWKAFTAMSNFQASLVSTQPTVASIEAALTARGQLATMASGGTGDLLKFYFYGQDLDSQVLFLVEVKVTPSINYYVATTRAGVPGGGGAAPAAVGALMGAVEAAVRAAL